jgi:glycerol uptake facilitator-like aquaporin
LESYGGRPTSLKGVGGMRTKIEAAKTCYMAGCNMIIANSNVENSSKRVVDAEEIGTLFLAMVILAVKDNRNRAAPPSNLAPVFIGLTVAGLISFVAPLTQACFNPARDFGPRLFAFLAGWGDIALPGPRGFGFLTVYVVAPIVGAIVGAVFYDKLLRHP